MASRHVLIAIVLFFGLNSQADAGNVCTNPKMKMVSQSSKIHTTMNVHYGPYVNKNITVPARDIGTHETIEMSIDYEKFNMVLAITQGMTVAGQNITIEVNEIVNWDAGTYTMRISPTGASPTTPKCTTMKLPTWLPIKVVLTKLFDVSKMIFKCVNHHDGLDVFSFNYPPKFLPFPFPTIMDTNMNVILEVDDAGLIKSEKMNEKFKTNSTDVTMDMNMVFTDSRLGGPDADDLIVPESWGCKTVETLTMEDLLPEWLGSKSPFVGHNRIIPHLIRAMVSEQKVEELIV